MMEVKGTSVVATREFVKSGFGETGLRAFVEKLGPEAQKIYGSAILQNNWYTLKDGLIEPTKKICDIFYGGSLKGAWEAGRYSADHGLKGIYRLFLKVSTPSFIIAKAGTILPTYYKPSVMRADSIDKNSSSVKITEFPEYHELVEHRIGGWMEKALELCGCSGVEVKPVKSILKGDPMTEFLTKWN